MTTRKLTTDQINGLKSVVIHANTEIAEHLREIKVIRDKIDFLRREKSRASAMIKSKSESR